MRNAIPREAHAVLVFNPEDMDGLEDYMKESSSRVISEASLATEVPEPSDKPTWA